MLKLIFGTFSLIFILNLAVPFAVIAVDTPGTVTTVGTNRDAPVKKSKPHHKHKKKTKSSAVKNNSVGSNQSPDDDAQTRGLGNHAGEPNMGTGDHVPGTTGTSGQ